MRIKCLIQDTRCKILYLPIMDPSTGQNNHLQIKVSLYETGSAYHFRARGFTPVFSGSMFPVCLVYCVVCLVLFSLFCSLCPTFPLSLDCPFLIVPSVFSDELDYLLISKVIHSAVHLQEEHYTN